MGKAIQVKGLQKSYKQLQVLKGVDFEVEKGSIFALLGSNGAGKTTVVKILTTLLKQDSGTATVNGFDVASKPETCAAGDQSDRAICRRGRNFDRTGKSDHDCQAAIPQKSASGCGRLA